MGLFFITLFRRHLLGNATKSNLEKIKRMNRRKKNKDLKWHCQTIITLFFRYTSFQLILLLYQNRSHRFCTYCMCIERYIFFLSNMRIQKRVFSTCENSFSLLGSWHDEKKNRHTHKFTCIAFVRNVTMMCRAISAR